MKKLLNSKWTAIEPKNKEKHFVVIKTNEVDQVAESVLIEAIFTKNEYEISIQELKNPQIWQKGWK